MNVLVACEFSGVVRDAFIRRGHNAWSCDLLPGEGVYKGNHYQGDALSIINNGWGLLIAHPPCTYLCNSGVHWLNRQDGRWEKMRKAALFFKMILESSCKRVAVENPVMHKYAKEIINAQYDQTIQPYEYGHPESKRTCLWLKGLPLLKPTNILTKPECGYWQNQTPTGQNKVSGGLHGSKAKAMQWRTRSMTYQGVADAMAEQWGNKDFEEET